MKTTFPRKTKDDFDGSALHLAHDFFRRTCVLSIIAVSGLIVLDIIEKQYYSILIEIVAIAIITFLYFYSANIAKYKKVLGLYIVSVYGLMSAYFIVYDGGGIAAILTFFLVFIYLLIIVPEKYRLYLVIAVVIQLMLIFKSKLTSSESFDEEIYGPHIIYLIFLFLFGGIMIYYLKSRHEKLASKLLNVFKRENKINILLEQKIEERTQLISKLNEELNQHFYRSSHDFRRPLTSLMGLNEVARLSNLNEHAHTALAQIQTTVSGMDAMLKKFQTLHEISNRRWGNHNSDIKTIINNLIMRYNPNNEHTITYSVKTNYFPINHVSNHLIDIILDNLIENSIRFKKGDKAMVDIRIKEKQMILHIDYQDKGIGIRKENLDKVFDMYFRESEKSLGNGLGFYVVKNAVDKLMGMVSIESKVGKLTRIHISFPFKAHEDDMT